MQKPDMGVWASRVPGGLPLVAAVMAGPPTVLGAAAAMPRLMAGSRSRRAGGEALGEPLDGVATRIGVRFPRTQNRGRR